MATLLYLDTSAILRATLEAGTTPEIEQRIESAEALLTSRLAMVETARALHRVRSRPEVSAGRLGEVERGLDALWSRCAVFEIDAGVCEVACGLLPRLPLRTLDALHLATYLVAKRRLPDVELVTSDERMVAAHAKLEP